MTSEKDKQELLAAVHAVDKRVAVLEAQHDLRWEQQDKLQAAIHQDVREIKKSVVGLRTKVAVLSVVASGGAALFIEIAKKMLQ